MSKRCRQARHCQINKRIKKINLSNVNKSNWNIYWNEKWNSVADIVRRFCHFLLWRGEFCFDEVGYFELKKITPNCNALANLIISYLWVSYFTFVFSWQCKTMLFTQKKPMQWRHRSVRIALRDINKKGIEIGERQNRCHDDKCLFDRMGSCIRVHGLL